MLVIPARVKVVVVMVSALALAAGLLTLTLLAKPAQAQAQTFTDTDRSPFSAIIAAPNCPGSENVFIEATLLTVTHTTLDANGVYHTKFQFNLQGQGEGLSSGDKYVFNDVYNDQATYTDIYNQTITETLMLIRQGSDTTTDDLNAKALFHVTVNANGEVTAFVDNLETDCK